MSRRRRKAAYTAAAAAAMSEGPMGFGTRVASIPRLVRDTMSGRYNGLSKGHLLMMVVALLYVVSPIDLVPEALLTIPGLADDAAVAAWLIGSLIAATSAYRTWETTSVPTATNSSPRAGVIPGEVVTS